LLSELTFGSLLVYSPRGSGEVSVRSRGVVRSIKTDGPAPGGEGMIEYAVRRLAEELSKCARALSPLFREDLLLVPVPSSAPVLPGGLWVPKRICEALVASGFGSRVAPILTRTHAIPKSAFAGQGKRPGLGVHEASLAVAGRSLFAGEPVLLVDDVVTKGTALLAAARVVSAARPGSEVSAFALVRTMGLLPDVERILDPCLGRISLTGMPPEAHREP